MKKTMIASAALAAIALVGCKSQQSASLQGSAWALKTAQWDKAVEMPHEMPMLLFRSASEFSGTAGCNSIFGSYKSGEGTVDFTTSGSTKMMCPWDAFETEYIKALDGVDTYSVTGDQLVLENKANGVKLVYDKTKIDNED